MTCGLTHPEGVPLAGVITLPSGPEPRPVGVGPPCGQEPRSTSVPTPNLGLYWRTVRHLRWSQIGYLAGRRLLRPRFFNRQSAISHRQYQRAPGAAPVDLKKLPRPLWFPEWQPLLARQMIETGEFRFLNLSVLSDGRIPWVGSQGRPIDFAQEPTSAQPALSLVEGHDPEPVKGQLPRLWTYHLNYCDFLNLDFNRRGDPAGTGLRAALRIAVDWCEQNPTGTEPGWEPYPLSLRVVNWLKFLGRNAARAEALGEAAALARLLASLRAQVLALEHRLEKDLLANHLLKNIKALIFAGALLEVPESRRWWTKGQKLLRREIEEQILPDGGHFERSPMYHALALEDLMDIESLSFCLPATPVDNGAERISETVDRMRGYLGRILHPDGEIPLFNDSAFGVARPSSELLARDVAPAFRSASAGPACGAAATTHALADTGYAIIREADSESCLVFDAGPLGPDHQPGHGHCDILSYELSLYGQRVVVDTGLSTYEPGRERHYERSTAAHNTLRIDGEEQAEIWGGFRVGRRPHVGRLSVGEIRRIRFARGEYGGHRGVGHSRTVLCVPGSCWVIVDCLRGRGLHRVESFVHFHPSVRLEACERPAARSLASGAETMRRRALVSFGRYRYLLMTLGATELAVIESWYSPEFGLRLPSHVLSLTWEGRLPNMMVHAFVPAGAPPPLVGLAPDGKAIEINGRIVPLE